MLLVISRQRSESVMVGDDLLVTVEEIRGTRVRLSVIRKRAGGRCRVFDPFINTWLNRDEHFIFGPDMLCLLVDIRGDKVWIGFNCPKSISVHRKEVYDAIRRENTGDDDAIGSPVPR